jgi:hypothetical protein
LQEINKDNEFQILNTNFNATFANFNMNPNATFVMIHFMKLCYNVFILENKIDVLVFRKICVKMCYIMLKIALICVNMERVFVLLNVDMLPLP